MSIEIYIWRFIFIFALLSRDRHGLLSSFVKYFEISLKFRMEWKDERGANSQLKSLFNISLSRYNKVYWVTLPFFRKTWGLPKKDNNGTV